MKSPEQPESPETSLERTRRVANFIRSAAEKIREDEQLPIGDDGRIDMAAFSNVYPDLERDKQTVRGWQTEWYGAISEREIDEQRLMSDGEKLELLKSAIFIKNLGAEFFVMRASSFDDIRNGTDNILIEQRTGNIVCALDEVSAISGAEFEAKKEKVLKRNIELGGATLKYGIALSRGQKGVSLERIENIPVFYIALPKEHIEKGLRNFSDSGQSSFEKKLFDYFISTLHAQVKGLELSRLQLNSVLRERLQNFCVVLDGLIRKTIGK